MKAMISKVRSLIIAILLLAVSITCGYFCFYYLNEYYAVEKSTLNLSLAIVFLVLALIVFIVSFLFLYRFLSSNTKNKIKELKLRLDKWTNISYHATQAGDEAFVHLSSLSFNSLI